MGAAKENIFVTRAINIANSTMEEVMAQSFDAKGSEAGDYALIFDGDGDYVRHGDVFDGVQTISFWLQVRSIANGNTDYVIDFNGTEYIRVFGGTVQCHSNITSPTYYINAVADVDAGGLKFDAVMGEPQDITENATITIGDFTITIENPTGYIHVQ